MSTIALHAWTLFLAITRIISVLIQSAIVVVLFLAAVAEIASFGLNYGNVVIDSVRNIAGRIASLEIIYQPTQKDAPPQQCSRHETRVTDLHCQDETEPRKRFLCQVTIPPVEVVCVE
jgi:hypothetical protein